MSLTWSRPSTAAEVDEGAVGHEGADGAGDGVAFLDGGVAGCGLGAGLLFKNDAAIDDYIFVGDVELGDAAVDLGADQLFELGGVFGAAAAGGHEGADADIDREAALDDFSDGADDGELLSEGGFEGRPVAGLRDLEARELVVVLLVAAGDGDGECVAGLDAFGVVLKGGAGQNAFSLVADVEKDLVGGEGDDGALQLLCAGLGFVRVAALEVAEQIGEGLGGFFFDGFRCGRLSNGDLGLGSEDRFGDGGRRGFGDRFRNGFGRDFFGGQGLGDVFFSHDRLFSILPWLGGGRRGKAECAQTRRIRRMENGGHKGAHWFEIRSRS